MQLSYKVQWLMWMDWVDINSFNDGADAVAFMDLIRVSWPMHSFRVVWRREAKAA